MASSNPHDRVCVALDFPLLAEAEYALDELQKAGVKYVKAGYDLLYAPDGGVHATAQMLKRRGLLTHAFWDGKLKDGPKRMGNAAAGINALGYGRFSVHAKAGSEGLKAAVAARGAATVIGVTLLTHLDYEDLSRLGYPKKSSVVEVVTKLIHLCRKQGVDRIVCSANEVIAYHACGEFRDMRFFVPGARLPDSSRGDQKRIGAPRDIIKAKAEQIIVGGDIVERARGARADVYLRYCDEVAAVL